MPGQIESTAGILTIPPEEPLRFRANGKLLIAGEYLVLAGARALALPLRFGQSLQAEKICGLHIYWASEDTSGTWFRAVFDSVSLKAVSPDTELRGHETTARKLTDLLKQARSMNPGFLKPGQGYNVRVTADFPLEWGLGSSSSLISLISQWAEVNASELHRKVSNGSGYDIACATSVLPIFYTLNPGDPEAGSTITPLQPGTALRDHACFAYLGRKQDSHSEVEAFSASAEFTARDIRRISELSEEIGRALRPGELCRLMHEHEEILGRILKRDVLKAKFPDFPGSVKSLGTWGGDFAMFVSRLPADEVRNKLESYGISKVYSWNEICYDNTKTATGLSFSQNLPSTPLNGKTLSVSWESPSNIAFIKYWGKRGVQLPANPSLSMTLSRAVSRTTVRAVPGREPAAIISVNGDSNHSFIPKMRKLLIWLKPLLPAIEGYSYEIDTTNSFPSSAGIASSASGISAFSLCLLDLARMITGEDHGNDEFLRMASRVSRMGSGSASRSVYGGFTVWGETPLVPGSSDEKAVPLRSGIHRDFLSLQDAILIVSGKAKSISSTGGHALMDAHPFAGARYLQANKNLKECLDAMGKGDFEKFARICEHEAISLHSLIMTSAGNNILMLPESLQIMNRIRDARKQGMPVCFSLDAGPNVHLLYPLDYSATVGDFISTELLPFCPDQRYIPDHCGQGPFRIPGTGKQLMYE
ncbi:MAG: GYDIA family GHMP kinase [Bacteroidetes bacterium]|nr:GYDIA family GHMP kinase [Bacteroidota bacterium]